MFDINLETFKKRIYEKHTELNNNDRYETFSEEFHIRVMQGFREIAKHNSNRCILIDANTKSIQHIHTEVLKTLQDMIKLF